MNKDEYKQLVKKYEPKENKLQNFIIAFIVGGLVGLSAQIIIKLLIVCFSLSQSIASMWTCLIIIFLASLFTALGFFDDWMIKCKAGLLIPTTGFAHSISSSALDYKKEGLITGLGANFFKLAGSVILYGILSSFILVLGRVIIGG